MIVSFETVFNSSWVLFRVFTNIIFLLISYDLLCKYYPYFSFSNSSFRIYPVLFGPFRLFLSNSFWSFSVLFGSFRSFSALFGPFRPFSALFGPLRWLVEPNTRHIFMSSRKELVKRLPSTFSAYIVSKICWWHLSIAPWSVSYSTFSGLPQY